MGAEDTAGRAERLQEQRRATVRRIAALAGTFDDMVAASRDTNADDEHDPEGHTIAFERSQVAALTSAARVTLGEIDAALERLARDAYGICERCGTPIAPARLEARPAASTCIECARRPSVK